MPVLLCGSFHIRVIGGNDDALRAGFARLIRNPDHHWFTRNISQRLAWQAGRGESRRDDGDKFHRHSFSFPQRLWCSTTHFFSL